MGDTTYQSHSPDSSPDQHDRQEQCTASVIEFPPPRESSALHVLRSFAKKEQTKRKKRRRAKKMLSRHAKPYWPLTVGARVAAISDGKIVQGVILGTKMRPLWPAAFRRKGFAGCWILLDSGERVVGYELRPIDEVNT